MVEKLYQAYEQKSFGGICMLIESLIVARSVLMI